MQNDSILGSVDALRRNFFFVLGVSVVVSVLAYGIAKNIPGTFEVHFSYMISLDQKDTTPGFQYDGYYGLSAAELFSETLASVASSPEIIVAAYTQAGMALPTQDAIRLVRIVRSEKASPQLVRLIVSNESKQSAEKLANALTIVLNKVISDYNDKGLSSISFHGVPTQPFTFVNSVSPVPIASSVFMLIFVGGNMVVLFREAMKRGSP